MLVTILDVAKARGVKAVDGAISGSEFERVGLPFIGGCQGCEATIAAYNAYPSKTGYLQCSDCIEHSEQGFNTTEQFEAWCEQNP